MKQLLVIPFLISLSYADGLKELKSSFSAFGIRRVDAAKLRVDKDTKVIVDGSNFVGGSASFKFIENLSKETGVPNNIEFTLMGDKRKASTYQLGDALYVRVEASSVTDPVLDLWIDLSPPSKTPKPYNLKLNNGVLLSTLGNYNGKKLSGSPQLSFTSSEEDKELKYSVIWDGNDLDGDSIADRISFDLIVQGYQEAVLPQDATEEQEATLGKEVLVSVKDGRWGIGDDLDLDAGESLVFSIDNVAISAENFSCTEKGFSDFSVAEIDGKNHKVISGESLEDDLTLKTVAGARALSTNTNESLLVNSGGSEDDNGFQVNSLSFHLRIKNPEISEVNDPSDYSNTEEGIYYRNSYPAQKAGVEFPEFSWEKVPLWLAVRKGTAYTEEELSTIANNFYLVLLEKQNKNGLEFQDDGAAKAAHDIKVINPNIKVLTYWNSYVKYGLYALIEPFEESWHSGEHVRNPNLKLFDIENAKFREWWVNSALTFLKDPNIDGIFIDTIRRHGGYFYDENGEPVTEGYAMLNNLRQAMPEQKILVGNTLQFHLPNANRHLLECFDGAHTESWDEGARRNLPTQSTYDVSDSARASIQYMSEAASKGKLLLMQATPIGVTPADWDTVKDVKFPLALYLMAASPTSYFSFNSGVNAELSKKENHNRINLSPDFVREFNRPLGEPKGPYVKSGDTYTREFEHLTVSVNVETQETTYEWAEDADGDGINDEQELDEHGSVFKNN